jgi:hypothetical protein
MKIRALHTPFLAAIPLAVAAILLLAGPGSSAAASAKPCSSSGLVIWAGEEPGGGAAGSFSYRIEFTNLSGRTCRLSGAPGVSAVDLHGKRIGAPASVEPGKGTAALVTLAPGRSATATLRIVDALNFPKARCRPTLAAGLRVTVPGGSGAKVAPLAFETCASPASKTLVIANVTALK